MCETNMPTPLIVLALFLTFLNFVDFWDFLLPKQPYWFFLTSADSTHSSWYQPKLKMLSLIPLLNSQIQVFPFGQEQVKAEAWNWNAYKNYILEVTEKE